MKPVPTIRQKKKHSKEELYNLIMLSYYDIIESTCACQLLVEMGIACILYNAYIRRSG
jgi:hypothetical protein